MVPDENRSAAAIWAVSTGSAVRCLSQPGFKQSRPKTQKTLGPGALDRGFLCAFVTLDRAASKEAWATGGKPASSRAVEDRFRPFRLTEP
jgi:hypothetical protein